MRPPRPRRPIGWPLLAVLTAMSCSGGDPEVTGARYNVLLVSMDSVRQDRLGCYGHTPEYAPKLKVSPNIDALAAEGVVFDQAWATTSWTLPSHMSMLTGLTDATHGVVSDFNRLDPLRPTLAQILQDQGYRTGGYYSGPYLDAKYGFASGFDDYQSGMMSVKDIRRLMDEEDQRRASLGQPKMVDEDRTEFRDHLSHRDITSPAVTEFGLEFLEANQGTPFFLFLHYFDAHYDHIPEQAEVGLDRRFDPDYSGSFSPDDWYFNPDVRDMQTMQRRISERDLGHIKAMYDAEIHWVDRHIGRIIERLKELGLYENTVIAVVSDHGDEFFEHGSIGHRRTLHPEVLKVPLVMRAPGFGGAAGLRVAGTVRLYDLPSSLVDLAGAGDMPANEGRSLKPLLLQQPEESPRSALGHISGFQPVQGASASNPAFLFQVFEVWRGDRYSILRILQSEKPWLDGSAEASQLKQVWATGQYPYEFFDRSSDPFEQRGLDPAGPAFKQALGQYTEAMRRHRGFRLGLNSSPMEALRPGAHSPEEIARLIDMGYVDAEKPMLLPPRMAPFPEPLQPPQ